MLQQAIDFHDESLALHAILAPLEESALATPTGFKQWTPNDIVAHLHFFNEVADLSLTDEAAFARRYGEMAALRKQGMSMREATDRLLDGVSGHALLARWEGFLAPMSARWAAADPKRRVKWVGPSMSVLSSISARLMETWAHGQAVYDQLGLDRVDTDRIRSVAVMGVNTFEWTFRNRGFDVPVARPAVRLVAPSGAAWDWPAASQDAAAPAVAASAASAVAAVAAVAAESNDVIEGSATEFCQVVTQVRNIGDTALRVHGPIARQWMSFAQCFAGPPEDPPAVGLRRVATLARRP